jgi:hypothetical protein
MPIGDNIPPQNPPDNPPTPPPQDTWQQRLLDEEKALSDNIQKLLDYIASPDFQNIANDQQLLLQQQREAMQLYDQILNKRIKLSGLQQ